MKKSPVLALAGLSMLAVAAGAPAMAASPVTATESDNAPIVGNLQHTPMQYWCTKGVPNFFVAVRAVKSPETSVTVTEVQLGQSRTLGPVTHTQPVFFFSTTNQAGKAVTLVIKGNTSGSTFTVSGKVPTTCAGLPNVMPNGTVTKPAVPAKNALPVKPHAPTTGQVHGPKVQTDFVATKSAASSFDSVGLLAAAGGAVTLAGVGAARRRTR